MNYIFKLGALGIMLFVVPALLAQGQTASHNFDKTAYYAALAGDDIGAVNAELSHLTISLNRGKAAFEGALLMKKAGLSSKIKDKLSLFKSGRTKLEAAIKGDEGNVEYHFLRLVIQENSPKIVKYKNNLKNDTERVRASFKNLSPELQAAVKDYSKKSTLLKPADF